ncbi:uncharacterized protein MELLADRAFT_105115 [Melampsora larici-populina 98AG31]|uniref:Uncharacterized protein n=1 Tax=Melampsora larici-populina (strain 98AG31 / pathotype 3-4-7) TaxID=747676 RepID=F4RHG7_MELLP|nr:uncharacterized protein MELLADRAFT_105115 [Melampsora larici-populina 98AG31]EGG08167.1 hypothetical protein MELLADRAFT_105115 [Melampsora larici-populina 98AG31]
MDQIDGHSEEEPGLTFEQCVALCIAKEREAQKRQQQPKLEADKQCARKERTVSNFHCSSPKITAAALLQCHLPPEPTTEEVEHWVQYASKRTQYLDVNIQQKMEEAFARNPLANECNATRLSNAEVKFCQCGFYLINSQWNSSTATLWNMAMLDTLVTGWSDVYNARAVPTGFPIDTSLNVPLEPRDILSCWITNKHRLCDKQAAAVEPYFCHFAGPIKVLLNSKEVHSETKMDAVKPGKFRKIKLNWRTPELDELIQLADKAAPKREGTKKQKDKSLEFFQSRGEYLPNIPDAEDQLPPKMLPKCLIKPEILTEGIDEITIDSLELSDTTVDLKTAIDLLKQKLGKGNAMTISSS